MRQHAPPLTWQRDHNHAPHTHMHAHIGPHRAHMGPIGPQGPHEGGAPPHGPYGAPRAPRGHGGHPQRHGDTPRGTGDTPRGTGGIFGKSHFLASGRPPANPSQTLSKQPPQPPGPFSIAPGCFSGPGGYQKSLRSFLRGSIQAFWMDGRAFLDVRGLS